MQERDYTLGHFVAREGDPIEGIYMILSGEVQVSKSRTLKTQSKFQNQYSRLNTQSKTIEMPYSKLGKGEIIGLADIVTEQQTCTQSFK